MISMKKTALAAAVLMSVGAGAAEAGHVTPTYPIVNFSYAGTFTMLSSAGGLVGTDPALTGTMDVDAAGAGHAAMTPSTSFFGAYWTAHNITLQMMGPSTATASMLFDWNGTYNITVTADFSMTPMGPGTFSITTLDGGFSCGTDGIAGCAMNNGPFSGFNATFGGTVTVTGVDPGPAPVPVPAAVWLLGSGLLGLVGVARRKKSA